MGRVGLRSAQPDAMKTMPLLDREDQVQSRAGPAGGLSYMTGKASSSHDVVALSSEPGGLHGGLTCCLGAPEFPLRASC